jgi:hypothetical protein
MENPLSPSYAARYGIPSRNANPNFILSGSVDPGLPVMARIAPGYPPNGGGAIEVVTVSGAFRIDSFYMPDGG